MPGLWQRLRGVLARVTGRRILLVGVALAGVVIAGYAYREEVLARLPLRRTDAAATFNPALFAVPVRTGDITRTISAAGNLKPVRQLDLRFPVSGRVQAVQAARGQRVEAGQVLAVLDNTQQELALLRARNAYEVAKIESPPSVVRERELDLRQAEDNWERTFLRAPFAGLITQVRVEPGQTVGPSDAVVQLIDDTSYIVDLSIDEVDIQTVQVGQTVIVRPDAYADLSLRGEVTDVALVANVQGGVVTLPVEVRLLDHDPRLRAGLGATAEIVVAQRTNVVLVPMEALHEERTASFVSKVVGGEVQRVQVQTGLSDGINVEIVSGLARGDRILPLNMPRRSGGPQQTGGGPGGFPGFPGGSGVIFRGPGGAGGGPVVVPGPGGSPAGGGHRER